MSDKLVLQINSFPALEAFLGGDTEVEIALRNSIVQEFSKKYLKNVAADLATPHIKRLLDEALREFYEGAYLTQINFSENARLAIRVLISKQFNQLIEGIVEQERQKAEIALAARLIEITDKLVADYPPAKLNNIVDELVKQRLKASLGLS